MTVHNRTDRSASIAAAEYIWDIEGYTEVHTFVVPLILRRLEAHRVRTVLDLGCGNGALTGLLAGRGFEAVGLDLSASGIEVARRNHPGVPFERHDLTQPIPDAHAHSYDAVVSVEVIEHMLLPRKLFENALAALRPGGVFLLTTPYHGYLKNLALALADKFDDHWHVLKDYGHVKFFSKRTILALFSEFGLVDLGFETVGRIPALARSMIVSGTTPP
jgi:2-polyprenyl-3-methyl-5-hydroxy-6-metoxy-1,4-benzoquinol methylase